MWRIPKEVLATRDAGRALNYVLNFVNDPVGFAARVREIYADPLAESFDILALKDGRTFERLSRPQMLGNEVIGRVWSFRDISDKKKAEDKLRESEERYRAVIETTETGFVVLDRDGLVLDANQEYIRITGYRRLADITGRSVTEWTADYDLERNAMEVTECFERGFVRNLNIDYVHSDGTIIPIEINATVVDTNKGPLIVTICRDNTARKRFEEALNESRERIQLILNSMAEGIYGLDLDGRCTFCNPSAAAMLGYDDETELVGRDMHQLVHHTKADGAPCSHDECIAVKAVRDKVPLHSDSEVLWRADGRSFPAEFWAYPIIKNDAVLGTVVTFVNISERVALERQLLQAQKMEAVGHLAGGIAHDFNNNLSAIIGYAYLLRAKIAGDDAMASDLDQILDSANRAAEVTRSLLAFSRQQVMNPTIVNINDLVLKLEKLITRLIGEDIEVTINLSPDPVTCMIDAVQIEQVLINIFTNARDAMPDGGRLEISTSLYNHEGGSTVLAERMKPGLYAVITVTDTGHGMDPATMSKIFEPFYTTKEFGRGTGLGLSMVYGIVKQNQGYIDVESSIGVGTAFRIYFHVVRSSAAEMTGSKEAGVSSGGTETILIAEDDPRLRKLYNIILTKSGYRTIEAENGEEAVTKFAEAHDAIDIVLMDMIMPKKSGKEAYAEIRIIKPDAKVIFLSGYTADRINDDTLKNEDVYFITKPVQPKDLTRLIRKALDS